MKTAVTQDVLQVLRLAWLKLQIGHQVLLEILQTQGLATGIQVTFKGQKILVPIETEDAGGAWDVVFCFNVWRFDS